MNELKAMKAVYCYFFPEIRVLMREVAAALPDSMFLVTTPLEEVKQAIGSLFDPPLDFPSKPDGTVDLDELHVPVIERVVKAYKSWAPALGNFPYSYPTSGSSEGLFHILAEFNAKGIKDINVLSGEYEGYGSYAEHLGMNVNWIDINKTQPNNLEPGIWFISNPSARNGNIIPNEFITSVCEAGHKVVLDLAYAGATKQHEFDVSHENICSVVLSLSKPYGLFRFRIGFAFSRDEMPSLYGNKWFKDDTRLLQGLKIVEEIGPGTLYKRYHAVQSDIIDNINREPGFGLRASDALLLAYLTNEDAARLSADQLEAVERFKRGSEFYRFCLTPYFEIREKQGGEKNVDIL